MTTFGTEVKTPARIWSDLTKPQRVFLWWAAYWSPEAGRETVGCGARGATLRAAARLESRGLVRCVGVCPSVDDHSSETNALTYDVTEDGLAVLRVGHPNESFNASDTGVPS